MTDDIDVMNMSIGLINAFVHNTNTDTVATEVTNVVNNGRGGLGGILVKAAGNDRSQNFDTNGEVLASKRGVITVASVDRDGRHFQLFDPRRFDPGLGLRTVELGGHHRPDRHRRLQYVGLARGRSHVYV